jgi:hypothetical protein
MRSSVLLSAIGICAILTGACGDSKEPITVADRSPARVALAVDGTAMTTDTLFLPAGQTVTVRATFFNSANDNLDGDEASHYTLLTFLPAGLASGTIDPAHHFTQSVQVQGAVGATGTVSIGYGETALADDHTLSAIVKIQ